MKTKSIILALTLVLSLFSASFATNVSPLTTTNAKHQLKDSTCAEIILKQGEIIDAKINKITENTIEYVKCGTSQPVYEISKDKVLMIKYPDGRTEKFDTGSSSQTQGNTGKTGGIIAFAFSMLGLLIAGALFGTIAVIMGAISYGKMKKANAKGKGWPLAAIIIGTIEVIFTILYIAIML